MNNKSFLILKALLIVVCLQYAAKGHCVHDDFAANTTKHFYNDLDEDQSTHGRILETEEKEGEK